MWGSPRICVYDWSNWKGFLILAIWPKAERIEARFGQAPRDIAARMPRKARLLLNHVNISIISPFISDAPALIDLLRQRDIRTLNSSPPDIRKRTIQSICRELGLPCVSATAGGPADELLIVKTDLNSGGRQEQLLTAAQRQQFNLPADAGRMKNPDDYFIARRADLPADIWADPTLIVERFIQNPLHRFFRVYAAIDAVVISEAYTETNVKRMEGPIRRHNYFLWRDKEKIAGDDSPKLPAKLLERAGAALARFNLDYGAIDFVESEAGEFYPVDINKTPYWGDEKQAGMIEHLRQGFSRAIEM